MFSSNTETGVTVTYQDADNTIDVEINPAQTTITSLLATDIKIGEDDQTKIDFETADEIHFYAANVEQVYLGDNIFGPQSDSDVDLGSSSARWKDAHVDNINVQGTVTTLGLNIAGTTVTSNAGELNVLDGITAVVGELNTLDLGATAFGIALGSKAVILDSNKDYSGIRNFTTTGDVKIGSSTTVTPATQADDIVIDKGASESGITLVSTAAASLRFGDASSASVGYIEYNHSSNAFSFGTNGGTRLTIASGGDAAFSGNIEIPNDGTIGSEGTADGIKINSSGKIGINSSSTSLVYPLEVHGGNGDAIIFKDTTNSVTTWLGAFGGAAVAGALTSGDDFALYAGNAEKVRIASTGEMIYNSGGFIDFDGQSLQLNTQRNPNSGTFNECTKCK